MTGADAAARHPQEPDGHGPVAAGGAAGHGADRPRGRADPGSPRSVTSAGRSWPRSAGPACSSAGCGPACWHGDIDFAVHSLKDLPAGGRRGIALAAVVGQGRSARRPGRARRRQARRPARGRADRHRIAAPRGPAAADAAGPAPGPGPWQRGDPAVEDRLGRGRRGDPRLRGPGQDRPPGRGAVRSSSPRRCCPRRARARSPWSAWPDGMTWWPCWPAWTIRRAARPPPRNAACSPRCRQAAARPIGAYAAGTEELRLRAVVVAADGGMALRASAGGPASEAERLGREVAAELLRSGAGRYTAMSAGQLSTGDDDA